jgi:hypothetical protein
MMRLLFQTQFELYLIRALGTRVPKYIRVR